MKPRIIYKKRPKTVAQLKKELVTVLHKYIRQRDSNDGYFVCICCDKPFPVAQMQAGHFIPSTYAATKFDEDNIHGQSNGCNMFKRGNLIEYRPRLIKKIGKEAVEALEARRHDEFKQPREWYEEKILHYKNLINTL